MNTLGLTGSIGTGKSTVAAMFVDLGAARLDADQIAHRVIGKGNRAWRQIVKRFGRGVLNSDRSINRGALAEIVFADKQALIALESIIHPKVIWHLRREISRLRKSQEYPVAVVEVPLLFESNMQSLFDATAVVTAKQAVQIERLKQKFGWSESAIRRRIRSQWPQADKKALSDFVIDNSGHLGETRKQVKQIWHKVV